MHLLGVMATSDAVAWLFAPNFVQSSAYDLIRGVAGQQTWGAVMAIGAAGFFLALLDVGPLANRARARHIAATTGFAAYGVVCATVGVSIFVLSFDGSVAAITGASKWWLVGALTIWQLSRSYYRPPSVMFIDSDQRTVRLSSTGEPIGVLTPAGLIGNTQENQR